MNVFGKPKQEKSYNDHPFDGRNFRIDTEQLHKTASNAINIQKEASSSKDKFRAAIAKISNKRSIQEMHERGAELKKEIEKKTERFSSVEHDIEKVCCAIDNKARELGMYSASEIRKWASAKIREGHHPLIIEEQAIMLLETR